MRAFSLPVFTNEISALLKGKYSRRANPKALWPALFDNAFNEASAKFADHWSSENLYSLKQEVGRLLSKRPRRACTKDALAVAAESKVTFSAKREPGNRLIVTQNDNSGHKITFLATGSEVVWIAIENNPGRDTIEEAAEFARSHLAKEHELAQAFAPAKQEVVIERVRAISANEDGGDTILAFAAELIRESGLDDSWLVRVRRGKGGKVRITVHDGPDVVQQKNLPKTLIEKVRGAALAAFRGQGTSTLPGM